MNNSRRSSMDIKTLVMASFLTAISIVLTRFFYLMIPLAGLPSTLRVSFGEIPIMMSGFLFGPLVGGLTGLAADLIGVLINPQGAYFPGFTVSSILWGVIPGVFGQLFRRKGYSKDIFSIKRIGLTVVTCIAIVSVMLNTYWLSIMLGKGVLVLLPGRLISGLANIPIQTLIITTLLKYITNVVRV